MTQNGQGLSGPDAQPNQNSTLPTSTSPFEPAAQHRYESTMLPAASGPDVSRIDSGANLRQRAARRVSHDVESQIQAQKRNSSFNTVSATSLGGYPAAPPSQEAMPVHKPLDHHLNWVAIILMLVNFGATGFYFYIRVTGLAWAAEGLWEIYTPTPTNMARFGYSIFILVVEGIGVTALLPYALLLTRSILPRRGATGLPAAKHTKTGTGPQYPFHVRVMVPCYKEELSVIAATVQAALDADLPPGARRTVYLCDDGNSPDKRAWINAKEDDGEDVQYVTGRVRLKGEANGKSNNLNNCLKNVIYASKKSLDGKHLDWRGINNNDIIVVLDSDMVPNNDFFLKVLEVMTDPDIAFCQTPQAFHNISQAQDLFNNINLQFWEYWLPGAFAWGYIACAGTNFAVRARCLGHCGWFPTYTITEDYALGMELKTHGYQGTYLLDYLVVGEAPDEVRNVMRQRSRWCKGHMQVFFSGQSPIVKSGLPFFQRLWYSYGTWSYFCTIITLPTFILVPFVSLFFGFHPVVVDRMFAISGTAYYVSIYLVQNYCRNFAHLRSLWYVSLSQTVLWFTYCKAVFNSVLSQLGMKVLAFKATTKKVTDTAAAPAPVVVKAEAGHDKLSDADLIKTFSARQPTAAIEPPAKPKKTMGQRFKAVFAFQNIGDLGGVLDPVFIILLLLFCLATVGLGAYKMAADKPGPGQIRLGFFSPYLGLPMLWSLYNAIPCYLFLHYCFTSGPTFERACSALRLLGTCMVAAALGFVWLSTPNEYDMMGALKLSAGFFGAQASTTQEIFDMRSVPGVLRQVNLTGGLQVTGDPVKYGLPLATSMSMLAWSYVEHKEAYVEAGSSGQVEEAIRSAAEYIMSCHISRDPANQMFIAQVGDPALYSTFGEMPEDLGRIWTSAREDPTFTDGRRSAYVLDKQHVGADVIGASSAALAACSVVFSSTDFRLAQRCLEHARLLYAFATSSEEYSTYCQALKGSVMGRSSLCEGASNITTTLAAFPLATAADEIRCWIPDYSLATCVPSISDERCLRARQLQDVFTKKTDCCDSMAKAGIWNATKTAQGACALPDGQFKCFLPSKLKRTCDVEDINLATGLGCAEKGRDVYATQETCCTRLLDDGVISPSKPGLGICSVKIDQCWVKDLPRGTCIKFAGNESRRCIDFGVGQTYDDPLLCCNDLAAVVRDLTVLDGICSPDAFKPMAPPRPPPAPPRARSPPPSRATTVPSATEEDPDEPVTTAPAPKPTTTAPAPKPTTTAPTTTAPAPKPATTTPTTTAPAPKPVTAAAVAQPDATPTTSDTAPTTTTTTTEPTPASTTTTTTDPAAADPATGRRLLQKIVNVDAINAFADLAEFSDMVLLPFNKTIKVPFFNSSSSLDDVAWAAAWLFRATGNPSYLGDAQRYWLQHLAVEARGGLAATKQYYTYGWDNAFWGASVMLANMTDQQQYHDASRLFLRTWLDVKAPSWSDINMPNMDDVILKARMNRRGQILSLISRDGKKFQLKDVCLPERNETAQQAQAAAGGNVGLPSRANRTAYKQYEDICNDGIDNDCDGLVDDDDPDCPFIPVKYTDKQLAWTERTPLPNAAGTAFLAVMYAQNVQSVSKPLQDLLKCWALGQVRYMLGEGGRSYVVGYGANFPKQMQHRESSCPAAGPCNWRSAYYPALPNPGLESICGALVGGPDDKDRFVDNRADFLSNTTVGLHHNAPFTGALAGLLASGTTYRKCSSMNGLFQDLNRSEL